MLLIDSHAHLDFRQFDGDRETVDRVDVDQLIAGAVSHRRCGVLSYQRERHVWVGSIYRRGTDPQSSRPAARSRSKARVRLSKVAI